MAHGDRTCSTETIDQQARSSQVVHDVRMAILRAELQQLREQRDALRDHVNTLAHTREDIQGMTASIAALESVRTEPRRNVLIERYEGIIAEKDQLIEQANRPTPQGPSSSGIRKLITSARSWFAMKRHE